MSVPGGSVGTAFITILPDTDRFAATLVAQMKAVGSAADSAGNEAVKSSLNWNVLGAAIGDAGDEAAKSSADYVVASSAVSNAGDEAASTSINMGILGAATQAAGVAATSTTGNFLAMGASAQVASDSVDNLSASLAKSGLARGAASLFGGGGGRGISTDLGSVFSAASAAAQGLLSFLTLIAPTINIIIAALVGVVSLLGAAVVAAVALGAALLVTAGAMAFAAFRWRDLISQGNEGAETWKGALIAIEAEAFNMSQALVESFSSGAKAGTDMWTTIGEAGVKFLRMMQPVIDWIVEHVTNFFNAFNGEAGASSPFLDFMRTWLQEWKVLGGIINQGIEGGGGLLGFFEKYEAPAKAFVEGIAQVINAIRQMSAMGLGLNMDQLAEVIGNVFHVLSNLITVFPKFSNALVGVGLALSEFLVQLEPVIDAAIEFGATILSGIVEPILRLLIGALGLLIKIPIVAWALELAGALLLVAKAISTLTLSRVTFTQLVTTMFNFFLDLSVLIGDTIIGLTGLNVAMSGLGSTLIGGSVVIIAVVGALMLLQSAMGAVADRSKELASAADDAWASLGNGAPVVESLNQIQTAAATSYNEMSNLGKGLFAVQHIWDIFGKGMNATAITIQESVDKVSESIDKATETANQDILAGTLSEATLSNFEAIRKIANQGIIEPGTVQTYNDEVDGMVQSTKFVAEVGTQAAAQYQLQQDALASLNETLANADAAYASNAINAGQYATILEQLSGGVNSVGEAVNLTALKVEGASQSIAQSILSVRDAGNESTGALDQFALSAGQSVTAFRTTALKAFNDVQGGLLGTGAKVTEWFQQQKDLIATWKEDTSDAFNFVKEAMAGLADGTVVSFEKIRSTLQGAVQDQIQYGKNWNLLVRQGASQELKQQIIDLGTGGAQVLAGLVQGGRKGVEQVNRLVEQGVSLSDALATNMADAIGLTMDKLVGAVEILVSHMLGVSVPRVERMVDGLVNHVNAAGKNIQPWEIKFKVAKQDQIKSALASATGTMPGGGKKGSTGIFPAPDTNAIKSQYAAAGQAAGAGMSQGISASSGKVTQAATELGNKSVKATAQAIGAASPARKFIAIGRDAVDGLIKGVSSMTGSLTAQMMRAGNAMANGLRNGLIGGLQGISAEAVNTVQGLVNAVNQVLENASPSKVFYRIGDNMAEGMRLGINSGMERVHHDMLGHAAMLRDGFRGDLAGARLGISQLGDGRGDMVVHGRLRLVGDDAYIEGVVGRQLEDGRIVDRAFGRATARRRG